jgi:hypothetical protein
MLASDRVKRRSGYGQRPKLFPCAGLYTQPGTNVNRQQAAAQSNTKGAAIGHRETIRTLTRKRIVISKIVMIIFFQNV